MARPKIPAKDRKVRVSVSLDRRIVERVRTWQTKEWRPFSAALNSILKIFFKE